MTPIVHTSHSHLRYISRSKRLAVDYFDVIRECSVDRGLSVRKRAVKVRWEK